MICWLFNAPIMRFLHTADWHLGKTLRGESRIDEQRGALDQIAAAAIDAKVDAVLVAGDIYESAMPTPEAEALAYEFLARICRSDIPCVLIAGNHDHQKKLAALRDLLESLRIYVRAEVRSAAAGGIVELQSRHCNERALIATLPFVPERRIVDALQIVQGDDRGHEAYADRITRVLTSLAGSFEAQTVNLVLAHVLISGALFGTGERQLHLGQVFAIRPEALPANAHYAALGHLHRPQEIEGGGCRASYAGSPIELDFGEREQDKRAVLIEAHPGQPAQLHDVPLTAGRRLRDLHGTLAELEAAASDVGNAFLRVTVQVPEPTPGIEERVRQALPNALEIRQQWPRSETSAAPSRPDCALQPAELFTAFHERERGIPPPADLKALFAAMHAAALRDAEQP